MHISNVNKISTERTRYRQFHTSPCVFDTSKKAQKAKKKKKTEKKKIKDAEHYLIEAQLREEEGVTA
jgi:hypothetical protein